MRSAFSIFLAVLFLAGCTAKDADEATTPTDPDGPASSTASSAPTTTSVAPIPTNGTAPPLTLTDCRNFGAVFPVPVESAKAVLPQGFEPVPASTDPAGGATLYVLGLTCADSAVGSAKQGPLDLLYAELAVVPSKEWAVAGVPDATVPILFTTANEKVAQALADLQLGLSGAGTAAWVEHTGAGDVIVAANIGSASLTLRGGLSPAPGAALDPGRFVVYGVQDGAVRTVVDGAATSGTAVDAAVTLEATGAPAPIGEARPAARGFSVSGFSLTFTPRAMPSA